MVKERNYNPAQEFHKKRKQEHIKKAKAEKQKLRNEKLAKRDPRKIEMQIQELKSLEQKGQLSALDQSNLAILESDLKKVLKARKHMGPIIESEKTRAKEAKEAKQQQRIPKNPQKSIYYDPVYNPYGVPPPGMPYKEWSDMDDSVTSSEGPSTPESIAAIPMPEGSPPPFSCLNKKEKKHRQKYSQHLNNKTTRNDNIENSPHYQKKRVKIDDSTKESNHPEPTPTIVYTADSILRNLKKESTAFIPTAVRRKASALRTPIHTKNTIQTPVFRQKPFIHVNAAPDVPDDS
ncbi:hypothetical protein PORY_001301 [Pneumocystis oryctolagi]|uniref:Uncharacterized protein n=1 Tax=Pneumocystis oryctolagi TaxID=42067 RepID=A0ACB7CBL9_9ASCO|nr:hypothetical protein PORY_001301 [Pneumocystis oryctolagi]